MISLFHLGTILPLINQGTWVLKKSKLFERRVVACTPTSPGVCHRTGRHLCQCYCEPERRIVEGHLGQIQPKLILDKDHLHRQK
jgi:hypothetical protein